MDMITTEPGTIRFSLRWLLLATVLFFGVGVLGGLAGQQLLAPPAPLLSKNGEQVINTVQEVTISPNMNMAEVVQRVNRSVIGLVRAADKDNTLLANAFVMTNDGVVVTTTPTTDGELAALDEVGQRLVLQKIGDDELFGLTYFRLPNNVIVPLDVNQENSIPGQQLQAISRSETTVMPTVTAITINTLRLPNPLDPAGWQQLLQTAAAPDILPGTPVVDDVGRIGGLMVDPTRGRILPTKQLTESFARILNNRREFNPFTELGFTVNYQFVRVSPESPLTFVATVASVTPGGRAFRRGLQRNDIILEVNDTPLSWDQSLVSKLDATPILTVLRDDEMFRLISIE